MCRLCARAEKCSMHGGWIGGGRQVNSEDIGEIEVRGGMHTNGHLRSNEI